MVSTQYELLRDAKSLTDVTFICDGRRIEAHKLVLYACSPYFKGLIEDDLNSKHLVFFFSDVKYDIMKALLEYMYMGEVHIRNEDLKEFIRVAEKLKVRGLDSTGCDSNKTVMSGDGQIGEKKRAAPLEGNAIKRVCGPEDTGNLIITNEELHGSVVANPNVVTMDGETTTDKICTLLASKTITGHEIQSIEVGKSSVLVLF